MDENDVERMFPDIATPFFNWRDVYDDAFESQGLNLGNKAEVFPDAGERVTWYTEGFLMSCWIALQEIIETVQYKPDAKVYNLCKGNLGEQFEEFIKDTDFLFD